MTTTIPAAPPNLFAFTEEHDALRTVLRDFLTATETLDTATRWRRLLSEVGVDEILLAEDESEFAAVELTILAEECGAALFGGPVLSTTALGALAGVDPTWAPVAAVARSGEQRVATAILGAPATALTVGGTTTGSVAPVWDCTDADMVIVAGSRDGETVLAGFSGTAVGVEMVELSGLDLSRQVGRLTWQAAPELVSSGDTAVRALAVAHTRMDLVVSAELLGVAQRALDGTVEYVSQRVQFGRTIGSFQAIKHRLADLLAQVELARSAVYGAAWQLSETSHSDQAGIDLTVAAVLAREAATGITRAAVQLHGGIAITWEHWAHRYLRRAHAVTALTGAAAEHRRRLAAQLRGRSADV